MYVPNSLGNTVDVIDPNTAQVIDHFAVGDLPQHVVPAWDLKTLYVTNDRSNTLTPIDPATGHPGPTIPVDDPYNMYFTPDGKYAIVVAERLARLDFRDPHTFELVKSLHVDCVGIDHVDFSADGRYLIASCEFSGQMVKVDLAHAEGDRHDRVARRELEAAGRQARSDRARLLRGRHDPRRCLHDRRRLVHRHRLHPDRRGRARLVREPRLQGALRHQPERRARSL